MYQVVKPGDSGGYPTVQVSYVDTPPMMTEYRQRIDSGSGTTYTLRKYYDGLGRLLQTQVAGAVLADDACSSDGDANDDLCDIVVDYGYDADGNLVKQTAPYALESEGTAWRGQQLSRPSTATTYDLLGRPTLITAPDGALTTLSYTDGGQSQPDGYIYQETSQTDGLGRTTVTRSDLLGRVRKVVPPLGPGVSYEYDAADRLTSATYGTAVTSLSYDPAGRKVQIVDPDLGTWSYAYDALGNLTRQADARGQRACLYYDKLDRLTGKHYRLDDACPASQPSPIDVGYTYDAGTYGKGYRTGMSDPSGSTNWTYDTRGRVTQESKMVNGSGTFASGWTYNSADLVNGVKYPNDNLGNLSNPMSVSYHPQLGVNSVGGTSNYVLSTSYDAAGRVVTRRQGSSPALVGQFSYYPWDQQGGRLQSLKAGTPGNPTSLLDFTYSYDQVGNLSSIVDGKAGGTQTQSFGYDALDRLTSAQATGGTQGSYDPEQYTYLAETGNLNSKAGVEYTYDPSRPHAVASTDNGNSYQYDLNGNQIQRNIGSLSYTLEYDAENRLTTVRQGTTTIATFTYDGDGRRVKGTINGVTTTYIGNLSEWTGSTGTLVRYYYAGGVRVAMKQGSTVYYLLGDHLGSTSVVATSSGGLYSKQLYKAWGEPRYASASLPTPYTYTGQYSYLDDLATPGTTEGFGLMFYNSRWFDPALGRWSQPDSIVPLASQGVQAWDRYAYANNNPVRYNDPTGHDVGCGGRDTSECASKIAMVIINGRNDRVSGYNSEERKSYFEYALEKGYQFYYYDTDNYDKESQKYNLAYDLSGRIRTNPGDEYYLFGHSAGADAAILTTAMTGYSDNIRGIALLDPTLTAVIPEQTNKSIQAQADQITANGIPVFLAITQNSTDISIAGVIGKLYAYTHMELVTAEDVFRDAIEMLLR